MDDQKLCNYIWVYSFQDHVKAIPDQGDRLGMLSWICWAVPLLIAEVCIQSGKLRQASE